MVNWPMQSRLLSASRNPPRHWQLYEPTVLLHVSSQPPLFVAHSFTSERIRTACCTAFTIENSSRREDGRKKNKREAKDQDARPDHDRRTHQAQLRWIEICATRQTEMASSLPGPANSGRELRRRSTAFTTDVTSAGILCGRPHAAAQP